MTFMDIEFTSVLQHWGILQVGRLPVLVGEVLSFCHPNTPLACPLVGALASHQDIPADQVFLTEIHLASELAESVCLL